MLPDPFPRAYWGLGHETSGGYSAKRCPTTNSKVARSIFIDSRRTQRIAAMTQNVSKVLDDDTSESTASEDEYSDTDSDHSSDDSSNEDSQELTEQQQQQIERKKELQQQTSALLLRLTRSLRTCKRNVDTLSPKVFRPNVSSLRAAVDSVLHVAERVKTVSISSTLVLKRLSQRAASIADLMYIPNGSYTSSSYCYLLRVRAILSLAMRVAAIMHGYTEIMTSGDLVPQKKRNKEDSGVLIEKKGGDDEMEFPDQPQPNKEEKTQDVQMDEENSTSCNSMSDVSTRKRTCLRLSGKSRFAIGEQPAKPSSLAISKEARKAKFDKHRNKRIATIMHKKNDAKGSESESNESDDSEDEYSNEESDSSSEEGSNDDISEQQQLIEKKKKLCQHISVFLLQLTKCLNSCKREVYTLSPRLVRPSISTLKEAVDNALYVTERIKGVSIKATSTLKRMTQTAATVARAVHIPDSMHSTATRSHYHSLLRIRRFLNLALRVSSVLHAFTEKLASGDSNQAKVPSDHESSQPDAEVKNQDVQATELSSSKGYHKNNLTEASDSDQKPPKLIVSVLLSKVSSPLARMNGSASVLHEVKGSSSKFRANNNYSQAVLDDVVDVGVVKGKRQSSHRSGCDPEMINDLLWKVRRGVVEKQRAESRSNLLHRVQKQPIFKTTCKKRRFSPYYAERPCLKNAYCDIKADNVKYQPIETRSPAFDPQSVTSKKPEQLKTALAQPAQKKWKPKPELSMDELADLFGSKCKISESVCITYANLSFKDPRQYELTSSVIPREKYPGIALQDGGVNFVLRASPLTPVLLCWKLEGKDFKTPNIPYFLKPAATLNYNSSFLREPAVNILKKEQDAHTQGIQTTGPLNNKECSCDQICENSNIKQSHTLVVSLPLFKIPTLCKRSSNSASPALHIPPHKLRKSESCQQVSIDDNGVVRENIGSQQPVDCDAEIDEVSENLSRCELVEKQSVTLKWNAMTSKSSHNKRFSPYPGRRTMKEASYFSKSEQTKCTTSRIQSSVYDPHRDKRSTATTTSLSKKSESESLPPRSINSMPSVNLPHAQSVAVKTSFSKLSSKPEEPKTPLNHSPQQKPRCKPELSMDGLADLFENKFKISDAVTRKYSKLSFRDPHQYSSVTHCSKHCSRLSLQDEGVNTILRDSPLTEVVCKKLEEKDGLIILPQSLLGGPNPDKTSEGSVNIDSGIINKCTTAPHTVTSVAATAIRTAIDAVMKKSPSRATLKQTRRRVHPNLSNILAARKNPRFECDPASETEEYRKMIDCDVEVSTVSKTNEQFQRVRLGKRSATDACLPVPSGK